MADGGHFEKMSAQKACERDIIWTVGWIAFKFDVMVRWLFRMIWLPFGKKILKARWLTEDILKKLPPKKLGTFKIILLLKNIFQPLI